ncbi:PREDICTED: LOW QUALITY PROTEIN: uncharacterized protein LOC105124774 [Populus euphratica]|uniref:LOW QUALITY PROTEIN: uncharacterized protein LOC105124774 n=1 Tax=Populus euphratica TaxID=75702 RepID=A0AAJ6XLC9_POPEU|nr:PREDICTED: LOW QUALITY PROTEIN: uncharacterized protein LOC105124774 [Populus euphratica]
MGEQEGWAQPPSGLSPNGLLPNEAPSVFRVLDSERWSKAEERTAELIACIQPNQPSEELRNAVADYVQRLIAKCFPCQVFTFGSVPLKTYLPDGDIDLTAFSKNPNLKDTWAHQVRDMLENEEKNENAEFRVKEVQYIQAEVKIIKCLVENIVVDISFKQLGGLCTLCFLEEVDNLINQNHLFKRSIILIKAWCYYESRILGAHHGLISTYALETLVLYIFHVFNNSFAGPLEVLYRFLEFFSKFDWDNLCVSLWGPVPISSLPDVTAEPPRKDGGELLLSKLFLEACSAVYAVLPAGQDDQGQPFLSKHFNVIDPLRVNNNLGRSVNKGNFFRIRSAFAFGAKRLARLLDCPKEDLRFEVNQFFLNTWERHGSGHRPDAPRNDLWLLRLSKHDHLHGPESLRSNSSSKPSSHEAQVDVAHGSCTVPFQHDNYSIDSTSKGSEVSTLSHTQSQKTNANTNSTRSTSDQSRRESTSNQSMHADRSQRNEKPDNFVTDFQGRYLFARTRSSPELTETYGKISSQGRHNKVQESGKGQSSSARLNHGRRKNLGSDNLKNHGISFSSDDPSSVKHTISSQSCNPAADSNSYHKDSCLDVASEEFVSVLGSQGMHQEEQDLVNVMASSTGLGFNGQVHVPLNMAPGHISLPIPPSVLASMGYGQRNMGGMVPVNIPFLETPWGSNMQFPQGLVPSPLAHYLPGIELTSNQEDSIQPGNENIGPMEMNVREPDHDFWHEQERGSISGFDIENGSFEMHQLDDPQPSSSSYKFVSSSRRGGSGNSLRAHQKLTRETRGPAREESIGALTYQENRGTEEYFDDRSACSRSFTTVNISPLRSKTSSESSWEGSAKLSKPVKEKRDDDNKEWNVPSTMGLEPERSIGSQTESSAALHVSRHQVPGYERAQPSESDSLIPIAPVLLGHGSRQRSADNSGSGTVHYTFYPAGPPVPFITMLPLYNFPTETGTSGASTSQFDSEEGLDNSDFGQNFDSSEGIDLSEASSTSSSMRMATSVKPLEQKPDNAASVKPLEHESDILNSDFASHWQNLQFGRLCENTRNPAPVIYPSPVMVPPVYLQGRFPWDCSGRPVSTNTNNFTQLSIVPVALPQSASNRPAGVYQHYIDEMPRYRGGTGTYLPNPFLLQKVAVRDRHASNMRKGNHNYNRSDHHGDREVSWNTNSRARAAGRGNNRSHAEKSNTRPDRLACESQAERTWGSHRHDMFPSCQSQNGPIRSNTTQSASRNVAYGMYPLPSLNPGVSSNGPTIPSVVMLYPYDHNTGYGSAGHLELGLVGPVGFSGANETLHLNELSRSSGGFEDQRFHGSSAHQPSPDQPSSPHVQTEI